MTYRCEACGRFQDTIPVEHETAVGNSVRRETTIQRYCDNCHQIFLRELAEMRVGK